jgi:hypothetical protein
MKTNRSSQTLKLNLLTPRFIALGLLAGVLVLMLLGLTGCQGRSDLTRGENTGVPVNFAGDYQLVSVNGKLVPCIVSHEDHEVMVKSGLFTISTNATCRSQSVFCIVGYRDVHRVVDATCTVSGTNLTMRWKGAGVTKGTIEGGTFTMNNEGMIFVYRK